MSNTDYWKDFFERTMPDFINRLSDDEIIDPAVKTMDLNCWQNLTNVEVYARLRNMVTPPAIGKLQNRYRQYKNRRKHKIKNIQLKDNSLTMLKRFQKLIQADTLEEAIEFLLSPDYADYKMEVTQAKMTLAEDQLASRESFYKRYIDGVPKAENMLLALMVEEAYTKGWKDAKASRKRGKEPLKDGLKGFKMLNDINNKIISQPNELED